MKTKRINPTLLLLLLFSLNSHFSIAQLDVEQLANLPGQARERVHSFAIGDKLYIGGGRLPNSTNSNEVWSYEPATETWTQMGNFPGVARRNSVSWADENYGYVGLGFDGAQTLRDFWRYDPGTDSWTTLAEFPVDGRWWSTGLYENGKGYVACGGFDPPASYPNDIWEYDIAEDSWSKLTDHPGPPRYRQAGFIAEGVIYLGLGRVRDGQSFVDFWAYDIAEDEWAIKANIPSLKAGGTFYMYVDGKFIVGEATGTGEDEPGTDLFIYDPIEDTWTAGGMHPGRGRTHAFAVVVDSVGYFGLGRNYILDDYYNDLYKVKLSDPSSIAIIDDQLSLSAAPNPFSQNTFINYDLSTSHADCTLVIYDIKGQKVSSKSLQNQRGSITVDQLIGTGTYWVRLETGSTISPWLKLVKL